MPGYKYPNIDSGATPIRSAGCAPDRNLFRETLQKEMKKRKKLEPMIDYKYPTVASGATPIGSAGRAPDEDLLREDHQMKSEEEKFESMDSTFTPIGRADSRTR
jgi:hypothetical protein